MVSAILIADDDLASCLILQKMLTDFGFCCDVVHDGVEAVQAACGKQYDMILLDLYMPVLSGIHAALAIRSLRSRSPVLIGISSSHDCDEASLCKDAGMSGILVKPFRRELIARLIQTLLPKPAQALAVHDAKSSQNHDAPRNASPDHPSEHILTGHQAPSCRAALQRAISVRGPVCSLQSCRSCTRSSSPSPLFVRNPRKTRLGTFLDLRRGAIPRPSRPQGAASHSPNNKLIRA
jgi:CheY-like chemotaxis protein